MDFTQMHLLAAKLACLLLILGSAGCGMQVDSKDDDQDAPPSGPTGNQMLITTDGGYSLNLNTSDAICRRSVGDQVLTVAFRQDSGDDAGLAVTLTATGTLNTGEEVGDSAADPSRFFEFQLLTPAGASYHFLSSNAATNGEPGPSGALTVLDASDFTTSGRVVVSGVAGANDPAGPTLAVQGSFDCATWE